MLRSPVHLLRALLLATTASLAVAAELTPGPPGDALAIRPELIGYNNQLASAFNPWANANRRAGLLASRAALLRYPGGTVSSYWDFVNGRLFDSADAIDATDTTPPLAYTQNQYTINWVAGFNSGLNTVADLALAVDATKADPAGPLQVLFVLNLITPGADYYTAAWGRAVDQTPLSADWWAMLDDRYARNLTALEQAEAAGIPVRYIELGNEYYFGTSGTTPAGAIVEPYSAGLSPADPAMRGAFPGDGAAYADAANAWAVRLRERFPAATIAAIGSDGSANPGRRQGWNAAVLSRIDAALIPAVSYHYYGGVSAGNVTTDEAALAAAFASWRDEWIATRAHAGLPTGREEWFTEFNTNQATNTWGHGLLTAHQILHWLGEGRIGLTTYHQLSSNSGTLVSNGPALTATGRALALLSAASRGRTRARPLPLDGAPTLAGQPTLPAVVAWVFDHGTGGLHSTLLINASATAHTLAADTLPAGRGVTWQQASAPLGSATADPGETSLSPTETLTLPPFSITVVQALDRPDSGRLINLSTRAQVGTGDAVLIPGLVIGGDGPVTLLVRAIGPGLAQFQVSNPLADPILELRRGDHLIATNDNWSADPLAAVAIAAAGAGTGAFTLAPGSADAALLVTVPPGNYTVVIRGAGETSGVALAEVYELR